MTSCGVIDRMNHKSEGVDVAGYWIGLQLHRLVTIKEEKWSELQHEGLF